MTRYFSDITKERGDANVNRKATDLDLAVLDNIDALTGLHEIEVKLRNTYHDVKVVEERIRRANRRMDPAAYAEQRATA